MTEKVNGFLNGAIGVKASGAIFIVSAAMVFVAFATETLLAIFIVDYGIKKRKRYFILSAAAVLLQTAAAFYTGNFAAALFIAAASVFLSAAVVSIPVKKPVSDENSRELFRFIDKKIKNREQDEDRLKENSAIQKISAKNGFSKSDGIAELKEYGDLPPDKTKTDDLDFSHVRRVMSRLGYYALSAADKKTVSELGGYLNEAERGVIDEHVKEKINDGLGALLKIMSKYGV